MINRNLIILLFCQMISATGSIVYVTLGGIIGASLSSQLAWSTLPISALVIATAVTTVPATMLMRRYGRRRGFALASCTAIAAVALGALALQRQSFSLFVLASLLFGVNMAFTQQYRYAAAESVTAKYVPRAISLVLVGPIIGAFAGKEIATRGDAWVTSVPYAGSLLALAVLYLLQALLFTQLRPTALAATPNEKPSDRRLPEIARHPVFLVAVFGGIAAYGLMTLIMTATPLSMHVKEQFSLAQTAGVIQAHVLGMYLPSLISGFLIERFGVIKLMLAGVIALVGTTVVGLQGQMLMHYWWALVLLGVGWNFLYVGSTTMLTYSYSNEERFRVQGLNELLVFGSSATASLLAGSVLHYFGWYKLMWIPVPFLLLVAVALVWVRKHEQITRHIVTA